jgi:GT2 family glycosyltransferase
MEREISIIIPSCNYETLLPCVTSIIRYTDFRDVNAEFVIVANGLPTTTRDWLDALPPYFRYLWLDNKSGVCKSTNLGASTVESKLIGKMDDDVEIMPWGVTPNWIKCVITPFSDDKVGLVAPAVFDYKSEHIKKDKSIVGFLMATRKEIWDKLGGFDEIFDPGIGEDTDFSFKVQDLGYIISLPQYMTVTPWNPEGQMYTGNFPIWHKSALSYNGNTKLEVLKRNEFTLIQRYKNI